MTLFHRVRDVTFHLPAANFGAPNLSFQASHASCLLGLSALQGCDSPTRIHEATHSISDMSIIHVNMGKTSTVGSALFILDVSAVH